MQLAQLALQRQTCRRTKVQLLPPQVLLRWGRCCRRGRQRRKRVELPLPGLQNHQLWAWLRNLLLLALYRTLERLLVHRTMVQKRQMTVRVQHQRWELAEQLRVCQTQVWCLRQLERQRTSSQMLEQLAAQPRGFQSRLWRHQTREQHHLPERQTHWRHQMRELYPLSLCQTPWGHPQKLQDGDDDRKAGMMAMFQPHAWTAATQISNRQL